jgi:hypothetical protein
LSCADGGNTSLKGNSALVLPGKSEKAASKLFSSVFTVSQDRAKE